jgi:hypothetical protein
MKYKKQQARQPKRNTKKNGAAGEKEERQIIYNFLHLILFLNMKDKVSLL